MTIKKKILLFAIFFQMAGCASRTETVEQIEKADSVLYQEALDSIINDKPENAAPKFEEVERLHPYSELATRAQIMAAWAFYQSNKYSQSVAALDRFVELNPTDQMVEYAYYLKALCYYEQIVDVERDAEMTKLALIAFEELVRRFPNGSYSRDSQLKIDLTKSQLAGKEMAVGRFYLQREQYVAALRRFDIVIEDYDTTNQVPEALYRKAAVFFALGLADQTDRIYKVAEYNYPNSPWTDRLTILHKTPKKLADQGLLKRTTDLITNIFD